MTVHRAPEYLRVGDHRVVARLGEGGQGTVYLGESPDGTRVAIKVLHARLASDPETRRRFLREAEVAGRVAPFCTAKVLGTGLVDERPYIISEYVPGPSLDELVKSEGPRSGSGLERLAVSTLTALASIHSAGIVHRDFKPKNVILGPEGPVVIDFGIARALDHMTTNSLVQGTPAYMSPEQFTDQPLTPASDMFSWACTMVFAATGRQAFPASAVPAIVHAILHREPDLSGVPESLRRLVAACLAKEPSARPAAGWLLRELTGGHRGPAVPVQPAPLGNTIVDVPGAWVRARGDGAPTGPSGVRHRRGRSLGVWAAVAAGAAALLVTAGVLVVPSLLGTPAKPVQQAAARLEPGPSLNLAAYTEVDVSDAFTTDTSGRYTTYQPFPQEELRPAISVGGGKYSGSGSAPFFGMVTGRAALTSDQAVVAVTFSSFAETGQVEDSVFVGWVHDDDDYLTAWYNNSRGTTGLDVRVAGRLREVPVQIPRKLGPGDSLALMLSGGEIISYAQHEGKWERLLTAPVSDLVGSPQTRQQYRYGFGLRCTTGTVGVARLEGRSLPSRARG